MFNCPQLIDRVTLCIESIILQAELRRMQQMAVELRKEVQHKKQLAERKVK